MIDGGSVCSGRDMTQPGFGTHAYSCSPHRRGKMEIGVKRKGVVKRLWCFLVILRIAMTQNIKKLNVWLKVKP